MPLYDIRGHVTRRGRLVVEAEDLDAAKEAFQEQLTDGIVFGLKLAEEDAPEVYIASAERTDGVYMTMP